jgi:hypothetical protein
MLNSHLHQPNDHLFKAIFTSPANAAAFLQQHLPRELTDLIPCKSVSIENSSLLDPALSNRDTDLLLRVPLPPSDAFMIVLLEHQSTPDARMPLRILGYILRILERFAREAPAPLRLPPIIPFLVSQSDRPWSGPLTLHELLKIPEVCEPALRPYQLQMNIHVLDLFNTRYKDLRGTPDSVLALRALKAKPVGELLSDAVWDAAVLQNVSTDALTSFLLYTLDAEDDPNAVIQRTQQFHSQAMNTARMSAAQQLIEQGRSQGEREGHREGISMSLLQNLLTRFGVVPDSIRSQLTATTSPDRLMSLLPLSIQCVSLQSFQDALSMNREQ